MSKSERLDVDGLQELLWGFAGQRVLTVAGRTGILERLARAAGTEAEVAAELGLDPLATGKVLRALVALGVLEAEGPRYLVNAELSPFLQGGPESLLPFVEHAHGLSERWSESLEPWLRGEAWTTQRRGPPAVQRFGEAMQAMGMRVARRLARALDLSGAERMLDLGGGFGHYARTLCELYPELRATVVDMPDVVALGEKTVQGTPLEGRLRFLGGNYLEVELGTGFDLALIANVLHQELPAQAAALVARASEALQPGGRLVVVDFAIDEDRRGPRMGALFSINMRSFGETYTESELRKFMEQAGLGDVQRRDLDPHRWAVAGTRRS